MNQPTEILQQTLNLARRTGDRRGEATTLCSMGTMQLSNGDTQGAMELFEQSIQIAREVGDLSIEGHSLWGMCMVWMSAGIDTPQTRDLQKIALGIFERLGDPMADLVREIIGKQQRR
jgi:Tetratricopeptide repeat